jgi:predicted aspartyl protease
VADGSSDRLITGVLGANGRGLVSVRIGICDPERAKREAGNHIIPAAETISGLIDTGCDGLAVSELVATRLGLTLHDSRPVGTAGGTYKMQFYRARVELIGPRDQLVFALPDVILHSLPPLGFETEALVGWSLLRSARLEYDGPKRRFELSF